MCVLRAEAPGPTSEAHLRKGAACVPSDENRVRSLKACMRGHEDWTRSHEERKRTRMPCVANREDQARRHKDRTRTVEAPPPRDIASVPSREDRVRSREDRLRNDEDCIPLVQRA
jgi:hypothetical protein